MHNTAPIDACSNYMDVYEKEDDDDVVEYWCRLVLLANSN